MSSIGIIANPASGKDIRRLVSHATVVDNNEKVNIVKRIILAAQGSGIEKVYIMPDTFIIGHKVIDDLKLSKELKIETEVLDMKIKGSMVDSINATEIMESKGVNCIIVLGGDGTHRAVAKAIGDTPLIGISTGTNNVYPEMIEGTVVGMAAAAIANQVCVIGDSCRKDKRIEIYRDKKLLDIALVDCVFSKQTFIGSKAIWNTNDILKVIVSRAHPASIGFSTLVASKLIIKEEDDFGGSINVNKGDYNIVSSIAAGTLKEINVDSPQVHKLNEEFNVKLDHRGVIALDGEREIPFKSGDEFQIVITRNGPFRVNIRKTLESAQENGFFERQ